MKEVTVEDILLIEENFLKAEDLYRTCKPGTFAKTLAREVIEPNLQEINKRVGQENDPLYLAYVIEALFISLYEPKTRIPKQGIFGNN